jgi:hypothetical protein
MEKRLIIIAVLFPLGFNSQVVYAQKKPLSLRADNADFRADMKIYPCIGCSVDARLDSAGRSDLRHRLAS